MQARTALGTALLVLLSALSACSDEKAAELVPGDVVKAREDDQFQAGRRTEITLPIGRLLVWTEDPVDRAGADQTRTRQPVDAPAGAVLVPITWQYDPWASDRLDGIVGTADTPRITFVTDSGSYRLPPPEDDPKVGAESFYVVADGGAGDAGDIALDVEFDGVTQSLDLGTGVRTEGQAAALYDIDDDQLKKQSCSDENWFDTEHAVADLDCSYIGPVLTPYANGEWAPEGTIWMALTLTTRMGFYTEADLLGSGARYLSTKVRTTARVNGEKAAFKVPAGNEADLCPIAAGYCGASTHFIFAVPIDDPEQGPIRFKLTYRQKLNAKWGTWIPERRQKIETREKLRVWKSPKDRDADDSEASEESDETDETDESTTS